MAVYMISIWLSKLKMIDFGCRTIMCWYDTIVEHLRKELIFIEIKAQTVIKRQEW